MAKEYEKSNSQNLPASTAEFIKQVLRMMRYRRKVQQEVQAELVAHFEDELKDCATYEEREQKAQQLIAEFGDVKLLAVLLRRAKKRCRPLWRTVVARTFQAVGILILCLILYTVWFTFGEPTISVDYLALLNQMSQPQISDEDNAWPHYEKAIELYIEPDQKILKLTERPREEFKIGLRFSDLNEERQKKILEWLEQNKSYWDRLDLSSKQLIRKCFQQGLVPYPYGRYRQFEGEVLDGTVEYILSKIEWQSRTGRLEPSPEQKMMAQPQHDQRAIKLDPDVALDAEIIAWFGLHSRENRENIKRGIEVGTIEHWINSPPLAAKSLFDCLLPFEKKLILKWIEDNETAWQEFVAGSSKSYCYRQYRSRGERDKRLLWEIAQPHLNSLRQLARLGIWRSRVDIEQGQPRQAFDDCLAVARAGKHWQGKGMLIEQLVGIAISSRLAHEEMLHITATQNFSATDLKQLQQQVSQIYPEGYPPIDMEGERLGFLDAVQRTFTEGGPGGGHLIPQRTHLLEGLYDSVEEIADDIPVGERFVESAALTSMCLLHARRNETVDMGAQIYDQDAKIVRMSPYQRHICKLSTNEEVVESMPKYRYVLLAYLIPATARVSELAYQGKASHEATVTILALKRWRLEKNEYPVGLDELIEAEFLKEIPTDPYSDKPFVYKRIGDDFTLYSLGADFDDDGGLQSRWGEFKQGGDQVFWPVPKSLVKQRETPYEYEKPKRNKRPV